MNDNTAVTQFIQASRIPSIADRIGELLPWIYDSNRRLYDHLLAPYGVRRTLLRWLKQSEGTLDLERIWLIIADDEIAGGYCTIPGSQMSRRRESDLIDLSRAAKDPRAPALRRRVQAIPHLFWAVRRQCHYLSALGATPAANLRSPRIDRTEIYRSLLNHCLDHVGDDGEEELCIDVDPAQKNALEILNSAGFYTRAAHRFNASPLTFRRLRYSSSLP